MSTLTPGYITGLTEGEGSFYVGIQKSKTKSGLCIKCGFSIVLAECPEAWDLLKQVAKVLDCGTVRQKADNRPNHRQQVRFKSEGHNDLRQKVIPFFHEHPFHGPKLKDFLLWAEILDLIRYDTSSPEMIDRVSVLRNSLNNGGRDRKY